MVKPPAAHRKTKCPALWKWELHQMLAKIGLCAHPWKTGVGRVVLLLHPLLQTNGGHRIQFLRPPHCTWTVRAALDRSHSAVSQLITTPRTLVCYRTCLG